MTLAHAFDQREARDCRMRGAGFEGRAAGPAFFDGRRSAGEIVCAWLRKAPSA
jgi:hypothetical protein